jgi:hypothetical protein
MTIRCVFLASALVISAIAPAAAAGDNVVLTAVNKVDLPPSLPGLCRLKSSITQVWEGKAFRAGQALVISVPCSAGNSFRTPANLIQGQGVHLFAVDVLLKSKQGLARIDDAGTLIWQPSGRSYGPWGVADGYRVLDGALVPAAPDPLKS